MRFFGALFSRQESSSYRKSLIFNGLQETRWFAVVFIKVTGTPFAYKICQKGEENETSKEEQND